MTTIRWVRARAGVLALLLSSTLGAVAVSAQTTATDAAADPAANDAAASNANTRALQEVVVTATKRAEDIQSTGLSITALTSAQLESKGVEQFFDYGNSIPNLAFGVGAQDGSLAARGVYLRGIQGANTTGFYIDDTPVLETLDPHIVDVDRIEVLRGPQGTLYGAESMGGTLRIITAQPTTDGFSAQVHSTLSDTDHGDWNRLWEGEVNEPLGSAVAVRASGYYQYDSGWFDKWIGPETGTPTGIIHDVGSLTYYGGQVAVKLLPVAGLSITPRIMFQETDEDGNPYATYYPDNLIQREVYNIEEGGHDRWWLGSLTINYTTSFGTFISSTGVFDRRTLEAEDDSDDLSYSLGLSTTVPAPITRAIGMHRFAQEARFASTLAGPFQFLLGGFYSTSTRPRNYEWNSPDLPEVSSWPSTLALSFIDQRRTGEYAVFGNVNYDITSKLKATAGVRWYRDTATFWQFTNGLFYEGASTYSVPSLNETGYTPKYELEYKVTPNVLAYASAAKGFRPGGDNIELPPGPAPFGCDTDLHNLGVTATGIETYHDDSLWDYEGGLKTSFDDRRYIFNATGYVIEWDNIQQLVALPLCGYGYTGNSGRAQSTGAEVEFSARPLPELTTGLSFGYENARITQRGFSSPQPVGAPVYNVPGITIASNIQYEHPVSTDWSAFGRVDYSHIGESWSGNNAVANPVTGIAEPLRRPAYNLTDLRGGLTNDRWEIAAYVKNLTNEHANLADAIMIGAMLPGQPRFVINQPRTIGLDVRLRFQ